MTIRIAKVYTENGPAFFLPNMDRYLVVRFGHGEDPGVYDVEMTLRTMVGDVEQIFQDTVEVDMDKYRERFQRLCSRLGEINQRYSDGEHRSSDMNEADMCVIDELGELCGQICKIDV